jgi:hypothetical protein
MKKPYMKKLGIFSGFKVWYVSGYWIRRNLDRRFPNYGNNRTFAFIPKDEFWIDYENRNKREAKYIIINFLAYEKELEKGKTEAEAIKIATEVENRERHKTSWVRKLKELRKREIKLKEKLLNKIHRKRILKDETNFLKIWIVDGDIVRSVFDVDFNQGGHGFVYPFIPKEEVWIDDYLYKKEIPFILIHELHERKLMARGWRYDNIGIAKTKRRKGDNKIYAHPSAEDLEFWTRHHPKSIKRVLFKEIKDNEKISKEK